MAVYQDQFGNPLMQRSPSQAVRIFGLDQDAFLGVPGGGASVGPPRPKFLFVVRFIRGAGEGSAKWKDGLSFAVRSFDRPRIQPQTQEFNQYNKKRLVHTGVKFGGVNVDFYDTVDSVVSYMWNEYAAYHFGDFRRQTDTDWKYDATNQEFYNSGNRGFGLTLPGGISSPDTEAGFFFEKVECYQFFGGLYTQFDLIHPKITSFDPDSMEYENGGSNGIRMSMDYETVIYHNGLIPAPIVTNEELIGLYGNQLDGNVYEPPGSYQRNIFQNLSTQANGVNNLVRSVGRLIGSESLAGAEVIPANVTKGLGVLSSFGVFDFGGGVDQILSPITGSLAQIANTDFATLGRNGATILQTSQSGINAAKFDVAAGQAQKALGPNAQTQAGLTAAYAESQINGTPLLTAMNNSRPSSSQIGFRTTPPTQPPLL